jgi:uncharacterized coiled-coil protein SlyX
MAINKEQIKEMANQIRNTTDPESLKLIVADHSGSLNKLTASMSKVQADILKDILPLLTMPSPTPTSILGYLGKLATGTAVPQLKAQVKLTIQLGELSEAIADISSAIAEAQAALKDVTGPLQDLANELQTELADAITSLNTAATSSLSTISTTQTSLNTIANTQLSNFDTSSVEEFNKTAYTELDALEKNTDEFLRVELP